MKDAKGHGSEQRGGAAHQGQVNQVGVPMQRRHYEALAGAINAYGQAHPDVHADLAGHFASALQGSNPNYNQDKFKAAAMTGDMSGGGRGRTSRDGSSLGMTRQHYQAVADTVKSFAGSHPGVGSSLAEHFAKSIGSRSPGFKPERFVKRAT